MQQEEELEPLEDLVPLEEAMVPLEEALVPLEEDLVPLEEDDMEDLDEEDTPSNLQPLDRMAR